MFPRSTASVRVGKRIDRGDLRRLDRLANHAALRHYAAELRVSRRRGLEPFVTVSHFSLPAWVHDPIAARDALAGRGAGRAAPELRRGGWLDGAPCGEFRKYAAYLAWKLGRRVDLLVADQRAARGRRQRLRERARGVRGYFPPGAYSFTAAIRVVTNLVRANAVAYDAIHALDRKARVGPGAQHDRLHPLRPRLGGRPARRRPRRLPVQPPLPERGREGPRGPRRGWPGDARRSAIPSAAGKADYIGVNYYFRSRVIALGGSLSQRIKLLDFLPRNSYRSALDPMAPLCPTACTDFGWEVYPEGFRRSLKTAGSYGLPVYVTENGLADADDHMRADYLVSHLRALRGAMRDRLARVRGYFHWTLVDNFEWSSGYFPRFGFFSYDPVTLRRTERPSARVFARIARTGKLP